MTHRFKAIFAAIILPLSFVGVPRALADTSQTAAQLEQIFHSTYTYSVSDRHRIFSLISKYWDELNIIVPRLSPDEESWFSTELKSGDEARILAANNTKIAGLAGLHSSLDFCRNLLAAMHDGSFIEEKPIPPANPGEREAFVWISIAQSCFSHNEFVRSDLNRTGLYDRAMQSRETDNWQYYVLSIAEELIAQDFLPNATKQ